MSRALDNAVYVHIRGEGGSKKSVRDTDEAVHMQQVGEIRSHHPWQHDQEA
jgi:hypothetical protein